MYSGETITTEISGLPVSVADIKSLHVIFHTLTKTLVEKTLDDCRINGEVIECTLSQDESLLLGCGPVTRSIVVITSDGARFERSNSEMVCGQTAKGEVIA